MAVTADTILTIQSRLTKVEETGHLARRDVDLHRIELDQLTGQLNDQVPRLISDAKTLKETMVQEHDKMNNVLKRLSAHADGTADHFRAVSTTIQDIQKVVGTLEARILDIEKRAAATNLSGVQQAGKPADVMNHKGLNTVPVYSGKPAEYEMWAAKARNLLYQCCKDYKPILKWVETQNKDFDDYDFDEAIDKLGLDTDVAHDLAEQLWYLISAKSDGPVFHMLRNLEGEDDTSRGARAWYRIRANAMGISANRLQALNSRVHTPQRVVRFEDLQSAIDCWEADLREYERVTDSVCPDVMKLGGFLHLIPEKEAAAIKSSPSIVNYDDARKYIMRQVDLNKSPWTRGSSGTGRPVKENKDAMDLGICDHQQEYADHQWQWRSQVRDDSGVNNDEDCAGHAYELGKGGGGKGRFEGTCDYCGRKGHRWRQCYDYQADQGKGYAGAWPGAGKSSGKGIKGKNAVKGQIPGKGGKGYESWSPSVKGFGKGFGKNYGKGHMNQFTSEQWHAPHEIQPMCSLQAEFKVVPPEKSARPLSERTSKPPSSFESRNAWSVLRNDVDDENDLSDDALGKPTEWMTVQESSKVLRASTGRGMPRVRSWKGGGAKSSATPGATTLRSMPQSLSQVAPGVRADLLGNPEAFLSTWKENVLSQPNAEMEQLNFLAEDDPVVCDVSGEWEEFESLLDSGASTNVASPCVGEGIAIQPSEGSKKGQVYYTANGTKLPNLGEKCLHVQNENFEDFTMTMQMAEVKKPLMAVSKVCDAGSGRNFVVFTAQGGYIWHADRGTYTEFKREGGVYPLKTWIRRPTPNSSQQASDVTPFARPGP